MNVNASNNPWTSEELSALKSYFKKIYIYPDSPRKTMVEDAQQKFTV